MILRDNAQTYPMLNYSRPVRHANHDKCAEIPACALRVYMEIGIMDIVKLPTGQQAPDEVDCISIERQDDGRYRLSGTALIACGDGEEAESVALVDIPPYDSYQQAEDVGLAWAAEQGVTCLYVSTVEFSVAAQD